jgi:sarcosine oxidase
MNQKFETIVIGCGGIGSAALYWLSRRLGGKVLGIEQFALGHVRGGSQDHSRIFRLAQHQAEYAELARHAQDKWREVEAESGVSLLLKTGGVIIEQMGSRDLNLPGVRDLRGYARAMTQQGIAFEELSGPEVSQRWPQFQLTEREKAIYQADCGLVDAAKSNAVHVALARARGATILAETPVREVRPSGDGVEVVTDRETYRAASAVVASGAWTNELLAGAGITLPLEVTQEQVTYYATPHLREFAPDRFPVWIWHGEHSFYGFPVYGEVATKMGQHNGGPEVTAETRSFEPDAVRQERYRQFLARYLPRFAGPELYTKTCLYTVPPDQNFVLDQVPEHPQISVVIGAGNAFKFATLLGKILSELALDRRSEHGIETFRIDRPAIQNPSFQREVHA